jgi:hypothetical protein
VPSYPTGPEKDRVEATAGGGGRRSHASEPIREKKTDEAEGSGRKSGRTARDDGAPLLTDPLHTPVAMKTVRLSKERLGTTRVTSRGGGAKGDQNMIPA